MKVKIIGIEPQSYTLDSGYSFTGVKYHAIDLETVREGLIGQLMVNFKVSSDSRLASVPVEVGKEYNVYFTQRGALDYIAPVTY